MPVQPYLERASLDPREEKSYNQLRYAYYQQKRELWSEAQERLENSRPDWQRYEPLEKAFPPHVTDYLVHVQTTGPIESYRHTDTGKHLHIDRTTGHFYDQDRNQITKEAALENAWTYSPRQDENRRRTAPELEARYAPLERRIGGPIADEFDWKKTNGKVNTYQHIESGRELHLNTSTGQFLGAGGGHITATEALSHALPSFREQAQVKEKSLENLRELSV